MKKHSDPGAPMPYTRVIPHSDAAGVIDATGPGVDLRRIGQARARGHRHRHEHVEYGIAGRVLIQS